MKNYKVITYYEDERGRCAGTSALFYPLFRFAEKMHFMNMTHRYTLASVIEEWENDKYVRTLAVFKRK